MKEENQMRRTGILLSVILYVLICASSVYGFNASSAILAQPEQNIAEKSYISNDHLTLEAGETKQLTLYGTDIRKATTDDEKVATVSKKGIVTAIAPGRAKIVLKGKNGKKHKCIVTVVPSDDVKFERKYGEKLYQPILEPYYQAYLNGWSMEDCNKNAFIGRTVCIFIFFIIIFIYLFRLR